MRDWRLVLLVSVAGAHGRKHAVGSVSISTPFGILALDPVSLLSLGNRTIGPHAFASYSLAIPLDPSLRGGRIPFQTLVLTTSALVLSSPLVVELN